MLEAIATTITTRHGGVLIDTIHITGFTIMVVNVYVDVEAYNILQFPHISLWATTSIYVDAIHRWIEAGNLPCYEHQILKKKASSVL